MKKCGFLSCMLLLLCLLFSLTGCVGYYMDEDSLQTEINQFDSLGYSSVSGDFTLLLSGTAIKIEYDVVGLNSAGEELWRETKSTSGPYAAEDSPLTLSVYCSEVSLSTSSVRVENIRVTGQGEYWLIALFAGLAAAGLGADRLCGARQKEQNSIAAGKTYAGGVCSPPVFPCLLQGANFFDFFRKKSRKRLAKPLYLCYNHLAISETASWSSG